MPKPEQGTGKWRCVATCNLQNFANVPNIPDRWQELVTARANATLVCSQKELLPNRRHEVLSRGIANAHVQKNNEIGRVARYKKVKEWLSNFQLH
jgi:hypothetical protein